MGKMDFVDFSYFVGFCVLLIGIVGYFVKN